MVLRAAVEMLTNRVEAAQQLQHPRKQTNNDGHGMLLVQFLLPPQSCHNVFLQPGKKCEMTWNHYMATLWYYAAVLWPTALQFLKNGWVPYINVSSLCFCFLKLPPHLSAHIWVYNALVAAQVRPCIEAGVPPSPRYSYRHEPAMLVHD